MKQKKIISAVLLALLTGALTFGIAFAHEHVHAGDYELAIGWAAEPPVAGEPNAITIEISDTTATDKEKEVDASKLTAAIAYGGQTKPLTLEKSWGTVNQYESHLIPSIAGQYTVQLRGKIGNTEVNVDVTPEEVAATDTLAFPSIPAEPKSAMRIGDWLGIGALVVALLAFVLAFVAFRKARK